MSIVRFAPGLLSLSALVFLLACDGADSDKQAGPCQRSELDGCGLSCNATSACAPGLHCNESGSCYAFCTTSSVATDCAADQSCSTDGHCLGGVNAGGDGGNSNAGGNGNGGNTGGSNGNVCADVSLKASITTPNVVLIIDQSGSMTESFDNGTRWTVLKNALLNDTGLIAELQNVVRFGVALYSYDEQKDDTCPIVTPSGLTVSLNALSAIRTVYMPAEPADNTPTGEAIDAVLAQVNALGLTSPDVTDPTIFVLATDGNPDTCKLPDQGAFGSANSLVATKLSIDAVKRAFGAGIRTFVLAVADEADLAQSHVNDLANAGVGDPAGPGVKSAPSYRVNDDQGLRDALRTIVTSQLSCDVKLNGKIMGDPCVGSVTLEDKALGCNDANGWKLLDESTIKLEGSACDGLKQGKPLKASFPCDSVVVL